MTTSILPDLTGRTAIVTGANSGIGQATAAALAGAGARVVLAVRSPDRGRAAAAGMPGITEVRQLDLASLQSIRAFADSWDGPIDLLINNAGLSAATLQHTSDGFELQFGTNHLGPFALTNLLLPRVTGRVVTLSSQAERMGRLDPTDPAGVTTPYREFRVYATSKLANLLFSSELQRRLTAAGSAVRSMAAHPGLVATNIQGDSAGALSRLIVRRLAQQPKDGALPVLYAATGDIPGDSFVGPQHLMHMRGGAEVIKRSKNAQDPALAAALWRASERLTGVSFPL